MRKRLTNDASAEALTTGTGRSGVACVATGSNRRWLTHSAPLKRPDGGHHFETATRGVARLYEQSRSGRGWIEGLSRSTTSVQGDKNALATLKAVPRRRSSVQRLGSTSRRGPERGEAGCGAESSRRGSIFPSRVGTADVQLRPDLSVQVRARRGRVAQGAR